MQRMTHYEGSMYKKIYTVLLKSIKAHDKFVIRFKSNVYSPIFLLLRPFLKSPDKLHTICLATCRLFSPNLVDIASKNIKFLIQ